MLLNCGAGGRLLRVSWTARRSNQSTLKEISSDYSLEGLMLKLKLQCFNHLMQRTDSFEKTLMLGRIEDRRRGWQRMRCLDDITNLIKNEFAQAPGVGDGQWSLACCSPWSHKESDMTEWLNRTKFTSVNHVSTKVVEGSTLMFLRVRRRECFQTIKMGISKGTSVPKEPYSCHMLSVTAQIPKTHQRCVYILYLVGRTTMEELLLF